MSEHAYEYVNSFNCTCSISCTEEDFSLQTLNGTKIRVFVEEGLQIIECYSLFDSELDEKIMLLSSLVEELHVEVAIDKEGNIKIAKKLDFETFANSKVIIMSLYPFWIDVTIRGKIEKIKIKENSIKKSQKVSWYDVKREVLKIVVYILRCRR